MNKDFLDALRALLETDTRFLVVGAFAVSVHAEPRATGDLDIWVDPTPRNAEKVYEALKAFGAPLADLTEKDLSTAGVVFQMGLPPNRIDIHTSVSGVSFAEAWKERTSFAMGGVSVPVIGRKMLLRNKRAAGRPKDRIDVELIEKHKA